jgi:hypothetical protein
MPECRLCGCTDDNACAEGCWWVTDPLEPLLPTCSNCVEVRDEILEELKTWGEINSDSLELELEHDLEFLQALFNDFETHGMIEKNSDGNYEFSNGATP